MSPDIGREMAIFFHAVLMGIILFAGYQVREALGHLLPKKRWLVHAGDILYWTGASFYLFVQIYYTNNGKIRWYGVLGLVFGAIFLQKILSLLQKMAKKMYNYVIGKIHKKC